MKSLILTVSIIVLLGHLLFSRVVYAEIPSHKIRIKNIWVNDFISSKIADDQDGNVLIADTFDFQIVYIRKGNSFLLSILNSPFIKIKKQAEKAFLTQLGLSRSAGCRLNVSTTTLNAINPEYANEQFPLPFCQSLILSDIDENCEVNTNDYYKVVRNYRYHGFDENEDVNGDGDVNAQDLSFVITNMGRKHVCTY